MTTFSLPFIGNWSTFPLTQGFGPVPPALLAQSSEPPYLGWAKFHRGLDFAMPVGTPILAAGDGTVQVAGWAENNGYFGYGTMVTIDHGNGLTTLYGHNAQLQVSAGDPVVRGQIIALSGSTGNSSGPHSHFEIDRGFTPQNPAQYLAGIPANAINPGAPGNSTPAGPGGLTPTDAAYYAKKAGIPDSQLVTAVAIAMAESGLNPASENTKNSDGSIDRGLWQINSIHVQPKGPYNATALFDPAYNARAMAAISAQGTQWQWWTTYTTSDPKLSYRQYLGPAAAGVLALTPSYRPGDFTPSPAGSFPASSTDTQAHVPQDTTPQQPVMQVTVVPVTPRLDRFQSRDDAFDVAKVWIATADGGVYLDPISLDFTVSEYYTPGEVSDLMLAMVDVPASVRTALRSKEFTQVIIYGGVVDTLPAAPEQMDALWAGVLDSPKRDFDAGTYTVSGPDYSGVFSNDNATTSQFAQFTSQTGAQIVTTLVTAHNPKGKPGLTVLADKSAIKGSAFGSTTIKNRQANTTEWDVMVELATGEAKSLYWEGTQLVYRDLPQEPAPAYLNYLVDGEDSLVVNPVIEDQPHAKRDARIEVSAWSSKTGQSVGTAVAGNHDATTVYRYALDVNTSLDACQTYADWLAGIFAATEYTLTFTLQGVVPLTRGQPICILSDDADMQEYAGQKFYPTERKYKWDAAGSGWTIDVTCTNRPYVAQAAAQTSASGLTIAGG